ncbi:MAG: CopG family transcriptional regulator [Gammaproteobacteria bacterium RIFCSPHIGHO2_12_FULL_45_9]|nr:MAG: CopG family transcriptional regulator [Gammaproteobacteria bacterium RIFCSPHIGHO2_12_FULL_45_9]
MPASPVQPTTVKITWEIKERIQKLAEAKQRSLHWLMLEAIQQYLEREEKQQAFREAAEDSWKAYQETGLHVTGKEVSDWLATWGTSEKKAPPKCHK